MKKTNSFGLLDSATLFHYPTSQARNPSFGNGNIKAKRCVLTNVRFSTVSRGALQTTRGMQRIDDVALFFFANQSKTDDEFVYPEIQVGDKITRGITDKVLDNSQTYTVTEINYLSDDKEEHHIEVVLK